MSAIENGQQPLLITVDQVAKLLSVSIRTVWRLKSAGKLPKPVEVGGSVRWNIEAVKQWIDAGCPAVKTKAGG
jgi:excisionase family DNA binding protein